MEGESSSASEILVRHAGRTQLRDSVVNSQDVDVVILELWNKTQQKSYESQKCLSSTGHLDSTRAQRILEDLQVDGNK